MTLECTFDIEGDGLELDATQIWCGSVLDHQTMRINHYGPDRIAALCEKLQEYEVVYGHNCIDYDFPVMDRLLGWSYTGRIVDTLLISRLLFPTKEVHPLFRGKKVGPHSVANWGAYLGDAKVEHEDWSRYSPEMRHRNIQDVRVQFQIQQKIKEQIALDEAEGYQWEPAIRLTCQLFRILKMQEIRGWLVDKEHLENSIAYLDRYMDRISRALQPRLPRIMEPLEGKVKGEYNHVKKPFKKDGSYSKTVVDYFGGHSSLVGGPYSRIHSRTLDIDKAVETKDYLLSQGWEPKEWNYDKDTKERTSPKLSKDDPFEGLTSKLGILVAKRIQAKQRKGTLEGWLTSVRPDGTISGRVNGIASTARMKHSVIVNVPGAHAFFGKSMRKVFICKPGWKLIGVDSAGNQMRHLAARMDDDDFTHALLEGKKEDGSDLHSLNRDRAGLPNRTVAKNFFYGCILFGAGIPKTQKIVGCSAEEAKQYKDQYFREMPRLTSLIERFTTEWRATAQTRRNRWGKTEYYNGYIKGLDGRKVLVEKEHTILAYVLQSDEAIHLSAAYCKFYKDCLDRGYEWGKDWAYLIFMHDEFQFECRPEIAEDLRKLAEHSISWSAQMYGVKCPHEGDSEIGYNWSETH